MKKIVLAYSLFVVLQALSGCTTTHYGDPFDTDPVFDETNNKVNEFKTKHDSLSLDQFKKYLSSIDYSRPSNRAAAIDAVTQLTTPDKYEIAKIVTSAINPFEVFAYRDIYGKSRPTSTIMVGGASCKDVELLKIYLNSPKKQHITPEIFSKIIGNCEVDARRFSEYQAIHSLIFLLNSEWADAAAKKIITTPGEHFSDSFQVAYLKNPDIAKNLLKYSIESGKFGLFQEIITKRQGVDHEVNVVKMIVNEFIEAIELDKKNTGWDIQKIQIAKARLNLLIKYKVNLSAHSEVLAKYIDEELKDGEGHFQQAIFKIQTIAPLANSGIQLKDNFPEKVNTICKKSRISLKIQSEVSRCFAALAPLANKYRSLNTSRGYINAHLLSDRNEDAMMAQKLAKNSKDIADIEYLAVNKLKDYSVLLKADFEFESKNSSDGRGGGFFTESVGYSEKEFLGRVKISQNANSLIKLKKGVYIVAVKVTLSIPMTSKLTSIFVLGTATSTYTNKVEQIVFVKISPPNYIGVENLSFGRLRTAYKDRGSLGGSTEEILAGEPVVKLEAINVAKNQ